MCQLLVAWVCFPLGKEHFLWGWQSPQEQLWLLCEDAQRAPPICGPSLFIKDTALEIFFVHLFDFLDFLFSHYLLSTHEECPAAINYHIQSRNTFCSCQLGTVYSEWPWELVARRIWLRSRGNLNDFTPSVHLKGIMPLLLFWWFVWDTLEHLPNWPVRIWITMPPVIESHISCCIKVIEIAGENSILLWVKASCPPLGPTAQH